ncbi:MAG TPA: hypothetical protein ENI97_01850 [Gammaproteobacteria bacterium]|nr:hypothetical protein [Gammaproteobacteria bacterium]
MHDTAPTLLSIIELGGYPDFTPLYQRCGFKVTTVTTPRKAIAAIKKRPPDVLVAEFNYQSDFRDRTSTLESMLATLERYANTKAIVFYEQDTRHQLDKLLQQFSVFRVMAYPIDEAELESAVREALGDG